MQLLFSSEEKMFPELVGNCASCPMLQSQRSLCKQKKKKKKKKKK
jgi:hypothetical protein